MARLLLFEAEELLVRFRPHPASYLGHYGGAFLWMIPGAAGTLVTILLGDNERAVAWGLITVALLGLLGGVINAKVRRRRMSYAWFAALATAGLVLDDLLYGLPTLPVPEALPLLAATALVLIRLAIWELDRLGHARFLTTERLVTRGGLRARRERSLPLRDIQEVRSERGVFGQLFEVGNLLLVTSRPPRPSKKGSLEPPVEVLEGVPRLEEIKHHLEQAVNEIRLAPTERRKRREERRVKDAMRALAHWLRSRPQKA